jgi:hypothetical protein
MDLQRGLLTGPRHDKGYDRIAGILDEFHIRPQLLQASRFGHRITVRFASCAPE